MSFEEKNRPEEFKEEPLYIRLGDMIGSVPKFALLMEKPTEITPMGGGRTVRGKPFEQKWLGEDGECRHAVQFQYDANTGNCVEELWYGGDPNDDKVEPEYVKIQAEENRSFGKKESRTISRLVDGNLLEVEIYGPDDEQREVMIYTYGDDDTFHSGSDFPYKDLYMYEEGVLKKRIERSNESGVQEEFWERVAPENV